MDNIDYDQRDQLLVKLASVDGDELDFYIRDIEMLENKLKSINLRKYYESSTCKKFYSLESALGVYKPGQILIAFTEICKFGIFDTIQDFGNMMMNYRTTLRGRVVDFIPYQIIISTESQKLVFFCTNTRKSGVIMNYVRQSLGSRVVISGDNNRLEFTVSDISARNYDHATELFKKLTSYVNQVDPDLRDYIHQVSKRKTLANAICVNSGNVGRRTKGGICECSYC